MSHKKIKQVAAAVLVRARRVLLACRNEKDYLGGFWEFPGGKLEENESPQACLHREIQEELCMKIEVGDFIARSPIHLPNNKMELLAYWARPLSEPAKLLAHKEIRWVTLNNIFQQRLSPADMPIAYEILSQGLPSKFPDIG